MSPTPVTIAYEYERPRFGYTVTVDGTRHTTEANYCVRRDDQYVFEEVTDIVASGATMFLERTETFSCAAASVDSFASEQTGTDRWDLEIVRSPSLFEQLLPWRWPPDADESPFVDILVDDELVHPDRDSVADCSAEVLGEFTASDGRA